MTGFTWIAIAASLLMGAGAVLIFVLAVKKDYFRNLEDTKYQVLLSGDSWAVTESTAQTIGCDEFKAEALPDDKVKFVQELGRRGEVTAIVGDGVNDAPRRRCLGTVPKGRG